jgi:uncharacterized protein YndB with AHSA1/START domain
MFWHHLARTPTLLSRHLGCGLLRWVFRECLSWLYGHGQDKIATEFAKHYCASRLQRVLLMKPTQVTDCRSMPFDLATVFGALVDFDNYPKWWPPELRLRVLKTTTKLVGSRFEVRPRGGSFVCEVARVVSEKEILIRYAEGLHRGTGRWTFERQDGGTGLSYQIDLEPQGWLPRLLSNFMNFAGMHSRGMERLFNGLQEWLDRRR